MALKNIPEQQEIHYQKKECIVKQGFKNASSWNLLLFLSKKEVFPFKKPEIQ